MSSPAKNTRSKSAATQPNFPPGPSPSLKRSKPPPTILIQNSNYPQKSAALEDGSARRRNIVSKVLARRSPRLLSQKSPPSKKKSPEKQSKSAWSLSPVKSTHTVLNDTNNNQAVKSSPSRSIMSTYSVLPFLPTPRPHPISAPTAID